MGEEHFDNHNENGSASDISRTMEEEIYWSNFKCMRFFLFLSGDFLNHLVIPKKFSENLRNKLPETVVLRGPGGATSKVNLVRNSDGTFILKDGWKEFAKAHHFVENNLLMFKYKRDSCFKVLVFDNSSFCENARSYFVRKCDSESKSPAENSPSKRKKRESSVDVVLEEADLDSNLCENARLHFVRKCNSESKSPAENSPSKKKKRESSVDVVLEEADLDSECARVGSSRRKNLSRPIFGSKKRDVIVKTPNTPNVLTRRPPSFEEKDRALQMAIRESTKESFFTVLKSHNVSDYYRFGIPAGWAKYHLTRKNQDLVLRFGDKKWTSRFNIQARGEGGVLVSGWYKFVKDNSLQKDDVCLFKLGGEENEKAIIDVCIFYAGDEPKR